jgi:hypothetical protein
VGLSRAEQQELHAEAPGARPPDHGGKTQSRRSGKVSDDGKLGPERRHASGLDLHEEPADAQIPSGGGETRRPDDLAGDGKIDGDSGMATLFVHGTSLAPKPNGWHRHLEGWQLAVVTVGIALLATVLAVPHAVVPTDLPLPFVDRAEERRADLRAEELRDGARARPLPFLVRAAGEAFRQFGRAEARGDTAEADALAAALLERVAEARKRHGDGPLLALRAVQAELFVRAVTSPGPTADDDRDREELGGAFFQRARANGWIAEDGTTFIEPDGLEIAFSVRWTRLAGVLETHPFAPTLNQWRLYYRTLLAHPPAPRGVPADALASADTLEGYVLALSRRDPEYPELLARGILAMRQRRFAAAIPLLSAHLVRNPSGPWRLRAQNFLFAAHRGLDLRSPR